MADSACQSRPFFVKILELLPTRVEATAKSVWWHKNIISLYKIKIYMDFMLDVSELIYIM